MDPVHDRAAIISTGDELVVGQSLDANSRWIAQQLMDAGILPVEHTTVPDDLPALVATLRRLAAAAPLIIMSGGLGPTDGDLTRPALAELLGCDLVTDGAALETLTARLRSRGREVSERQARQAQRPRLAECLGNDVGTAPGLAAAIAVDGRRTDVICLPGPPGELRPMWARQVRPRLRPPPGRTIATRLLHITGLPEAEAVQRLGDLTRRAAQPLVGITASGGVLTLRIRYEGPGDAGAARSAIDAAERRARDALGVSVFGADGESLAAAVLRELRVRGRTLGVVESCTGGLAGAALTDVPGSSDVFIGGLITYDNDLKAELASVPPALIVRHGAVSGEVARAMAAGGLERLGVHDCLAITGIAGPGGGSEAKPVGTVWIARASRKGAGGGRGASGGGASESSSRGNADETAALEIESRCFVFPGDREDVRRRAANAALSMLYFATVGPSAPPGAGPPERLLWERSTP